MVHQLVGSLVKRGVEMHDTFRKSGGPQHQGKPKTPEEIVVKLPAGFITLLVVTFFAFFVIYCSTSYTYGQLIPILTMVETPSSVLVESTTHEDISLDDAEEPNTKKSSSAPPAYTSLSASEPSSEAPRREALLITSTPVTASLRTTILHLRSIGGFASRFRGWNMFVVYNIFIQQLIMIFTGLTNSFVLGGLISSVVMAIPRLTWVHIVISSPSPKPFYKRFPTGQNFKTAVKKVTFLTLLVALAEVEGFALFRYLLPSMGGTGDSDMGKHHESTGDDEKDELLFRVCAMQTVMAALAWLAWSALFTVPLTACLAKIQTSLLPEDEDTIVNVERTEDMTLAEAWRSFDWNARVRVYKTYGKFVAIQTANILLFVVSVYFIIVAFLGWNWEETIKQRMFATVLEASDY